ncbi:MAG: ribonuclease H-like domain-containing protein [Dehalococcoidia bacterium]
MSAAVGAPAYRGSLRERLRAAAGLKGHGPQPTQMVDAHHDFLVGGKWEETAYGPALYMEKVYDDLDIHGDYALSELLDVDRSALAELGCAADPSELLFVDLETTGLNGGTGTLAFLVGAGRFDGRRFVLRQYFLAKPHFEPALLAGFAAFSEGTTAVVSYNGSSFDLPLLQSRYTMSRLDYWLAELGHVDLLHHARRFYSRSLDSCRLKELEASVLGVVRGHDIPGWAVPEVYFRFIREGVVGMMPAVVRHNALDVLSLATLLRRLAGLVSGEPLSLASEAVEVARLAHAAGDVERSLSLHRRALMMTATPGMRDFALARHLKVLKRSGRWQEVRDLCLDEVRCGLATPAVYIEGSKACEHHTGDFKLALRLTERALILARGRRYHEELAESLEKRRARLLRKLARRAGKS